MCGKARLAALALAGLIVAAPASAQGVFSGVVLGPDDQPVEGVTIYLTSVATSSQLEFTTLANGRFEFSGLMPGDYRVTSTTARIGSFVVTLSADEPLIRELRIPFGPFAEEWLVLPAEVLGARGNGGGRPGFRCSDRLIINVNGVFQPFCNLAFMVDEFEAGEQRRLDVQAAVGGEAFVAPRLRRSPNQAYPAALEEARIEGTVTIESRLVSDGTQSALRILSSDNPALNDAALASVRSAAWEPARMRGTPVDVPVTIRITFRLQTLQAPPTPVVQSVPTRAQGSGAAR
jgi:TonB family protein